jgi:hypothetical protein
VPRLNSRDKSNFLLPRPNTSTMAGSPMVRMFRMGNSLAEEIELFNCNIREVTEAGIVFYGSFVVLVLSFCNFDVCLFFFFF